MLDGRSAYHDNLIRRQGGCLYREIHGYSQLRRYWEFRRQWEGTPPTEESFYLYKEKSDKF